MLYSSKEDLIVKAEAILEDKIKNEKFNEYAICCVFDCEEDGSEIIVHKAVYGKEWGEIKPMLTVQEREKDITTYCEYTVAHFINVFGIDVLVTVLDNISYEGTKLYIGEIK